MIHWRGECSDFLLVMLWLMPLMCWQIKCLSIKTINKKLVSRHWLSSFLVILTSDVFFLLPYFPPYLLSNAPGEKWVTGRGEWIDKSKGEGGEEEEQKGGEGRGVGCWCDTMSRTKLVSPLKMINVGATHTHTHAHVLLWTWQLKHTLTPRHNKGAFNLGKHGDESEKVGEEDGGEKTAGQ